MLLIKQYSNCINECLHCCDMCVEYATALILLMHNLNVTHSVMQKIVLVLLKSIQYDIDIYPHQNKQ
jgi:hypothetical protein